MSSTKISEFIAALVNCRINYHICLIFTRSFLFLVFEKSNEIVNNHDSNFRNIKKKENVFALVFSN